MPFVLLAALVIVQIAVVVRDQAELDAMTRDAALSAARSPTHQISNAVRRRGPTTQFAVRVEGETLVVETRRRVSAVLPPFGVWLADRQLAARAVSLSE